jgi:hypothetical protein
MISKIILIILVFFWCFLVGVLSGYILAVCDDDYPDIENRNPEEHNDQRQ